MKNFTGFIIRQRRLQQGYSQEDLCRGICSVSYLSKIEQGVGNPSPAILQDLYARLGIRYNEDRSLTEKAQGMLDSYFDKFFHNESAESEEAFLDLHQNELENCELHLSWHIFHLYALIRKHGKKAPLCFQEEAYLSRFKENMEEDQLYLYYVGAGLLESDEQLEYLRLAETIRPGSFVKQSIAECWYSRREYMQAIQAADRAFAAAAEEGSLSTMLWSSYLLGACYSNFNDLSFMLRYYKRAMELARGYDSSVTARIRFNIGSAYLEHHRYQEAAPYLLASLQGSGSGLEEQKILAGQKLSVCYYETGQNAFGHQYLQQAMNRCTDRMPKIYRDLLYFTQLRYVRKDQAAEEYESLLQELFRASRAQLGEGYYRLFADHMIEMYVEQRRYKEALALRSEVAFV